MEEPANLCFRCNAATGITTMNCTLHAVRKRVCDPCLEKMADKLHCVESGCGRQINVRRVTRRLRPWICTAESVEKFKEHAALFAMMFGVCALVAAVFAILGTPFFIVRKYEEHVLNPLNGTPSSVLADLVYVVDLLSSWAVIYVLMSYPIALIQRYNGKEEEFAFILRISERHDVRYTVAGYYAAYAVLALCVFYAPTIARLLASLLCLFYIVSWSAAIYYVAPEIVKKARAMKDAVIRKFMEEREELVFLERDAGA